MSAVIPSVHYTFDVGQQEWRALGRPSIPFLAGREGLVPGKYVPGPSTAGLLNADADFIQVYPSSSANNFININNEFMSQFSITNGKVMNFEFWGRVRPQITGIEFHNCIFRGPDPTNLSSQQGAIQCYGSNPPLFKMYDCLIDPAGWPNFGTARNGWANNWIGGIHGGNLEMYRCEIKNCQDAVDYLGPTGSEAAANAAHGWFIGNWWHKSSYNGTPWTDSGAPSDQQPHCDGFQTSHGKNIILRGNMIGGTRVPSGYATWPGGYQAGDDFWNAGLMLKQEVNDSPIYRIENVLIEDNIIAGGNATINHAYGSNRPSAFIGSTIIRRNKIYTRGSDWGNLSPFGTGGAGYYIIRSVPFASMYQDNVIYETGAPAPIQNGA